MMIKRFAMVTALLLAASVASAHVPNIFVAGQPAKAQEINENFEHLLLEHSNYGVGAALMAPVARLLGRLMASM
jgi:hypothetical protein